MRRFLMVLVVVIAGCGGTGTTPTTADSPSPSPTTNIGQIVFGMAISEDRHRITAPSSTVSRAFPGILWFVVTFDEAPGAPSLTATLTRTSGGGATVTWSQPALMSDPQAVTFADGRALGELGALQPGVYVLRYLRDKAVLAEGSFEVN